VNEKLVQLCDCNACRTELVGRAVSTPEHTGAYCSKFCADHAGKELRIAQAEHRDAE
jgi:hypothetical protein